MSDSIYKRVSGHVTQIFEEHMNPNLVFHNLDHTKKVVERAQEIAAHYQLSENDTLTMYIAAWFHDTGHLFTGIENHEDKSIELMREYMQKESSANEALIKGIEGGIRATQMPHQPKNTVEEILCDADTYHFGTKEFKETNKRVKKEFALRGYNALLTDWLPNTTRLLEGHIFFTSYCKLLLEERKKKNIEWLKEKAEKKQPDNTHRSLLGSDEEKGKKKVGEDRLLTRGIQTMLRLTSSNHLELSGMADTKANILISVNSIILGIILSVLIDKLADDPYLTIPVIIFMTSCLTTIIIAILSTRPKITEGTFAKADITAKKVNLLFFGNYYRSTLEDYQWAMASLMKDNDYLYGVLIKDIHQLGVVLGRKYKLIRLAYNVFMIGLVVSVLSFFVAAIINYGHPGTTITTASGSPL